MEELLSIPGRNGMLRGVLHRPDDPAPSTSESAVIFLHGWSGNRQGPHRMFVDMARQLSRSGYHCLRFDFCGRGQSDGQTSDANIRTMTEDTLAALDFVSNEIHPKQIFLIGICSGSKVAISAAARDARVNGLALWSAEAMGYLRGSTANAHKSWHVMRSYFRKLTHRETWLKILTFQVNVKMVGKAVRVDESAGREELHQESAILDQFKNGFRGPVLFIYGSNDPETRIAAGHYVTFCRKNGIRHEIHDIAGANHSFYSMDWARQVQELTRSWITRT